MNVAYLSALSALAGSAIGALASCLTSWITQHYQSRQQRFATENTRRERLFGDFIEQAATLYADALVSALDDPTKLVLLYATLNKLRLFASPDTVQAAAAGLDAIIATYRAPNLDYAASAATDVARIDILRAFTEVARRELRR